MSGNIVNAFATGKVTGDGIGAGGLVGDFSGTIDAAFATGDVTGCNRVTACFGYGGLIGQIDGAAALTNVFATGDIAGWRMIGGLVGQVSPGSTQQVTISDAYATGSTYANDPTFASTGGLIGQGERLTLNRVFASGTVVALAGTWAGGLVGENQGSVTINNGYWDTDKTGYTFSCGRILCSGASGLSTNQSLLAASYVGWNVNGAGSAWRNYEGRTTPLLTALMTPAIVQMVAPNVTTTYNGADQTGAANVVVRLAANGNAADLNWIYGTTSSSCSAGAGNCVNAGTYTVTGTSNLYSDQFGYNLIVNSPLSSTLIINPAALNVTYTANAANSIYGNSISALSGNVSATGLVGSDTLGSVLSGSANWTTTASPNAGAGRYAITGSGLASSNGNYTINAIQAAGNATAYTIDPRAITVTANALNRTYGSANPALTYTIGGLGLVNGDSLSGALATNADTASGIGVYAITQGSLADANYAISYSGNSLTVTPAPLTVAGNTGSQMYTGARQTNGFTVTGLLNGDTVTAVSGLAQGLGVGTYADNLTNLTGNGLANYDVTFVNGALNITPAPLRIAGNAISLTYSGFAQTNGFTVTGLLGSDTVDAVSGLATGTNVGSYTDALFAATGTGLENYLISYANNRLAITPAPLTVTYLANATSGIYGSNPSGLNGTFSSTGILGNDRLDDVIQGTATWVATATSRSGVGRYAINGAGLTAQGGNYAVTFLQAAGNATAYTVTPRAITVSANALARTYGAPNPALSFTVGGLGLVNGDTLNGALATSAGATSNIGNYAITQGSLSNPNYIIDFTGADLTVTRAPLVITGDTRSVNFSGLAQSNTYTVTGLLNGDSVTGLSGLANGIDPGTYSDMLSAALGTGLGNYSITYANGALTIRALPPATGLVQFLEFTDESGNGSTKGTEELAGSSSVGSFCAADAVASGLRESGKAELGGSNTGCP
jgi:MBG domain (YGX type)